MIIYNSRKIRYFYIIERMCFVNLYIVLFSRLGFPPESVPVSTNSKVCFFFFFFFFFFPVFLLFCFFFLLRWVFFGLFFFFFFFFLFCLVCVVIFVFFLFFFFGGWGGVSSDYQYDRYSPLVTTNGFMNFVYMPYNCSAD